MTMDTPKPAAKRKRASQASAPSAPADPTSAWSAERWGSAVAARVYLELHRADPKAVATVDPALRRALGHVIRREVEQVVERVRANAVAPQGRGDVV